MGRTPVEPLPSFEELTASVRLGLVDLKQLLPALADKLKGDLGAAVDVVWTEQGSKDQMPSLIFVRLPYQPVFLLDYHNEMVTTSVDGKSIPFADWFSTFHQAVALAEQEQRVGLAAMSATIDGRPLLNGLEATPELTADQVVRTSPELLDR